MDVRRNDEHYLYYYIPPCVGATSSSVAGGAWTVLGNSGMKEPLVEGFEHFITYCYYYYLFTTYLQVNAWLQALL